MPMPVAMIRGPRRCVLRVCKSSEVGLWGSPKVSQSKFALRLAGREAIAPWCRVRQTDGYGRFWPNSNIPIPDDIDRKAPGRTCNTDGQSGLASDGVTWSDDREARNCCGSRRRSFRHSFVSGYSDLQ